MKILVLIKQVPDTAEVKLDAQTGNLIREGVDSIINPDDRHAIEAALQIKNSFGAHTSVLSMGPPQSVDAITEALAMGVDEGILLTDRIFAGADTWATSWILARAVKQAGPFDLVICGKQAIDGDTAHVGPQVAEFQGIPQLTYVEEIESVEDGRVTVRRAVDQGQQRVSASLPCLLTVVKEINQPRHARIDLLVKACSPKAPIKVWNAADLKVKAHQTGLAGSYTQVIKTFPPQIKRQGELFKADPQSAVELLLNRLTSHMAL